MSHEMVSVLIALVSAFTSSGVLTFAQFLIGRKDLKRNRDTTSSRMLLGLGHYQIMVLTDKCIRRGAITLKEKQTLEYLYKPYREMGGNGDCEVGYDACAQLRIVSQEEASKLDEEISERSGNHE